MTSIDFQKYQSYLGEIPDFLNKYLSLPIMQRLKDISLLCAMDYASHHVYDFKFIISRYDHSLNVALITWRLTHDKKATLAALFHDVSSPAFSHVIDFMNGDYIDQESTEEKTEDILLNDEKLKEYLIEDEININDILNFKDYSVVDLERPCMCADRLDNIISVGMNWVGKVDFDAAKKIIDSMYLERNEDGDLEIAFDSEDIALYVKEINDGINALTHTYQDHFMMELAASMIKRTLELELVSYDDLFKIGDRDLLTIIIESLGIDYDLDNLYDKFKNIKVIPYKKDFVVKDKIVNPLCRSIRL